MTDNDLINTVRNALHELEAGGVNSFTVQELQARDARLETLRPKEIDRALVRLWEDGEHVHQEGLGTDGCHLWAFGHRPPPETRRMPIGR